MGFKEALARGAALNKANEQKRREEKEQGGVRNGAMVCPHCQTPGKVATRAETVKAGISGGKAVAAVFTGGLSAITPGVGLSRKQKMTRATCGACRSTWLF